VGDVYEGAPAPVTGLLASVATAARLFALLMQLSAGLAKTDLVAVEDLGGLFLGALVAGSALGIYY